MSCVARRESVRSGALMWRRRKSHTHEYTQARENPFDPSLCTNVAPPRGYMMAPEKRGGRGRGGRGDDRFSPANITDRLRIIRKEEEAY